MLLKKIEALMKSSDYQFMPKGYPYKDFIENIFLPKIKRLFISMDASGDRQVQLTIDETYQRQLEQILLDIFRT